MAKIDTEKLNRILRGERKTPRKYKTDDELTPEQAEKRREYWRRRQEERREDGRAESFGR